MLEMYLVTSVGEQFVQNLLLLRWQYNPVQTYASFMDFSQSALFFDLPFQFVLHLLISVYIIPSPVLRSSSYSTSLRIIVTYLSYISFTIQSVNMTEQIQLTYAEKTKVYLNFQTAALILYCITFSNFQLL